MPMLEGVLVPLWRATSHRTTMEFASAPPSCTGSTATTTRLTSKPCVAAAGLRPECTPTTRKYPAKGVALDFVIHSVDRLFRFQGVRLGPNMIIPPHADAPYSTLISLLFDDIQHRIGDGQHIRDCTTHDVVGHMDCPRSFGLAAIVPRPRNHHTLTCR